MGREDNGQLMLFESLAKAGVLRKSQSALVKSTGSAPSRFSGDQAPSGVHPLSAYRINPNSRLFRSGNLLSNQKNLDYRLLRRVAEKAWLINTIIGHQINKVRPFLSISSNDNERGYRVALVDSKGKPTPEQKRACQYLERWLFRTGEPDPERDDSIVEFVSKLIRDRYTIDQYSTEMQRTLSNDVYAFWTVDPATVVRVSEGGYQGNDRIKFVQEIDGIVRATFTADDLVFGYTNPRSDIDYSMYGYSKTEQAIELILTFINAFTYNASAFTENRLPRGALLLQGDADVGDIEMLEDYIISLMQGGPGSQWKIPIIPSGGDGNSRKIEWISFQNSNREMEYSAWMEATWTAVAALFDTDLEELGIRTSKQSSVIGDNVSGKIENSKSRALASNLSFIKAHLDAILRKKAGEDFQVVFTGLEPEDIKAKNEARESELRTFKSIDEIRIQADEKPYDQPWSRIPLNEYVIQLYQASQNQSQEDRTDSDSDFGDLDPEESELSSSSTTRKQPGENIRKSIGKIVRIEV